MGVRTTRARGKARVRNVDQQQQLEGDREEDREEETEEGVGEDKQEGQRQGGRGIRKRE